MNYERENVMLEIDSIITNGYVDPSTIYDFTSRGWVFVCTVPANLAHPYAAPTDKLTIFSKYTVQPSVSNSSEATEPGV